MVHEIRSEKVPICVKDDASEGFVKKDKYLFLLSIIFFAVLVWSAIKPKDYFTWVLEVVPGVAGFIVLRVTYKKFRFTDFIYTMILKHCCILFIGGHYTYAEVPLFPWIKEWVNGTRNNYDKVGHFAQGFLSRPDSAGTIYAIEYSQNPSVDRCICDIDGAGNKRPL